MPEGTPYLLIFKDLYDSVKTLIAGRTRRKCQIRRARLASCQSGNRVLSQGMNGNAAEMVASRPAAGWTSGRVRVIVRAPASPPN